MAEAGDRRWRRPSRLAWVLAVLVVALLLLWSLRRPIATDLLDRMLAAEGVQGRYRIVALSPTRQRIVGLVLGDPARPDLVADEVELRLAYRFGRPRVASIRARGVRLRARLADGRLSFGAVDRLLPAPSGAPLALPDVGIDVTNTRVDLASPAGQAALWLNGKGNLANGFRGRLTATAPSLAFGGCSASSTAATLSLAIDDRRPSLSGPIAATRAACEGLVLEQPAVEIAVRLTETLDGWSGEARPSLPGISFGGRQLSGVGGVMSFEGTAARTAGRLALTARDASLAEARAGGLWLAGTYLVGSEAPNPGFAGRVSAERVAIAPALVAGLTGAGEALAATPVAPIARALVQSAQRAARDARLDGELVLARAPDETVLKLRSLSADSRSGARLRLGGGQGVTIGAGGVRLDGDLTLSGGGFPTTAARLRQARAGAPIEGFAQVSAMAAGDARLSLAPMRFRAGAQGTSIDTAVTLSGPLPGGRIDGLAMPIDGRLGKDGTISIGGGCRTVGFQRLILSGAAFDPTRFELCASGRNLLSIDDGRVRAGARVADLRLAGRSGESPLAVSARTLDLNQSGFQLAGLAARLGAGAASRLDIARLDGRFESLGGRFSGLGGSLANVPLLLSGGSGDWRVADGALALTGGLGVADAAESPRFLPLAARDARLTLRDGRIAATARLVSPATGTQVADVAIAHALATGAGRADLRVAGIDFGEALQPEALTPLTLGVVANVRGRIGGAGRIDWGPAGVTSSGAFSTDNLDLAAAFGPVRGLAGTIRFSDLLGLVSEPDQEARVAEIATGVTVTDGVIRYRLLPRQQVAVESGRWPFAGGTLTLQPTVLDLGQPSERRLTFAIDGLDAAKFVQHLELENFAATGTFDGSLPMIFGPAGGRIEGGRLAVRPGGGTLAYVGDVSNAQLGTWGRIAFDALKSIRYQNLSVEMDGSLDGELFSRVVFNGVNQEPLNGVQPPFARTLRRLPFRFNIAVRAPFRGLLAAGRGYTDPTGLIRDQIAIQPQESEE